MCDKIYYILSFIDLYKMSNVVENREDCEEDCEDDHELYKNCIDIIDNLNHYSICAYAPENELDKILFESFQNMDILKSDNIEIEKVITEICFGWQYAVGNITCYDDHPKCDTCKLLLPVDLDYYTRQPILNNFDTSNKYKDTYNLCRLCYNVSNDIKKEQLITTKINSGLDNIKDWVHIFTYKVYDEDHVVKSLCEYYCNLNPNSQYYKRFARNCHVYMLADAFRLLEEKTIEEIMNKYYLKRN